MSEVAFVTGGSGYLGRNLIRYLGASGYQVNALARSPQANAGREAGVKSFEHVSTEAVLAGGRNIVGADESWPPPPINITAYKIIGGEVTVDDSKARRELAYARNVSREAGLAELKQAFPAAYSGTT
jgi:NAD(P)-dependent dehydrogenase (short-subunit alcohol dehydrogenase family)